MKRGWRRRRRRWPPFRFYNPEYSGRLAAPLPSAEAALRGFRWGRPPVLRFPMPLALTVATAALMVRKVGRHFSQILLSHRHTCTLAKREPCGDSTWCRWWWGATGACSHGASSTPPSSFASRRNAGVRRHTTDHPSYLGGLLGQHASRLVDEAYQPLFPRRPQGLADPSGAGAEVLGSQGHQPMSVEAPRSLIRRSTISKLIWIVVIVENKQNGQHM